MPKVTPENALALSIAKWDRLSRARRLPDAPDGDNCPLCAVYAADIDCAGCPVAHRAGKSACYGTPYYSARAAWRDWSVNRTPENASAFRDAAKAEADFLRSLAGDAP